MGEKPPAFSRKQGGTLTQEDYFLPSYPFELIYASCHLFPCFVGEGGLNPKSLCVVMYTSVRFTSVALDVSDAS